MYLRMYKSNNMVYKIGALNYDALIRAFLLKRKLNVPITERIKILDEWIFMILIHKTLN